MKKKKSNVQARGFSLTEILIYVTILAVAGTFLMGIFINSLKVQNQQVASQEVEQQLNFVLGNIQRYIQSSSQIDIATSTPSTTLTLRMQDSSLDPTLIYLSDNKIFLKQGAGDAVAITSDKITANNLNFTKIATSGGHDTVQVDLMLSYTAPSGGSSFSKSLSSAIARVNAATFDSNLIPGADNSYDIGLTSPRWRNGNFAGNVLVNGNLGIRTTAPSSPLTIQSNASALSLNIIGRSAGQEESWVNFYRNNGTTLQGGILGRKDIGLILAGPSGTNDLSIISGGNVGIGTTNPLGLLHVSGVGGTYPMLLTNTDYAAGTTGSSLRFRLGASSGNTYSDIQAITTGGTVVGNLVLNPSGGNVGIGTTNPSSKFDIYDNNTKNMLAYLYQNEPTAHNYTQWSRNSGASLAVGVARNNNDNMMEANTGFIGTLTNNTLILGTNNVNRAYITGAGAFYRADNGAHFDQISDIRLKENIENLPSMMEKIQLLKPKQFTFKLDGLMGKIKGEQIGFIADDVEQVFPNWVNIDENGYKSLNLNGIEAILVKAIQEQQQEINNIHSTGLPEYADNAAATAAGLTIGAFYRTGDLLKVVH